MSAGRQEAIRAANRAARAAGETYKQGDYPGAEKLYREALAEAPDADSAGNWRWQLGLSLIHQGRCPEALGEFKRAKAPDYGIARCLGEAEDWDSALAAAERDVRAQPNEEESKRLLEDIRHGRDGKLTGLALRNRAEARHWAMKAESRMKSAWGFKRAGGLSDRGVPACSTTDRRIPAADRPAIEGLLSKALEFDPESPLANYYLACLHFDASGDADNVTGKLQEVDAGLAILKHFRATDPTNEDAAFLEKRWAEAKAYRVRLQEAQTGFEEAVAKASKGKPVPDLPAANEIIANPRIHAGMLARVGTTPDRIVPVDSDDGECRFQLHDAVGPGSELRAAYGIYTFSGAFECPWGEGRPLSEIDMVVRTVRIVEGIVGDQRKIAIPRLEILALQYGDRLVVAKHR